MPLSAEEHGIMAVLILFKLLLSIQTTKSSPILHNQGEIVCQIIDKRQQDFKRLKIKPV